VQAKIYFEKLENFQHRKRASKNHDFAGESPRSRHKNTITKYALFPKPPLNSSKAALSAHSLAEQFF
jgi:hypothetical protein